MKTFENIALEVSKLLLDASDCDPSYNFTRWSKNDLIHYAQDAIVMLSTLKPDWFSELKVVELEPGRVQEIKEGCDKIIKIIGVHGSVDADSPIASTVNDRLSGIFPSSCSESVSAQDYEIDSYTIEPKAKNIFYVSPPVPADGPVLVDIICSGVPEFTDDYVIPNWMHNLVIEWMMYRAYISEEESSGAEGAAQIHLSHFYSMIGNIRQADDIISGKVRVSGNAAS